MAKRASNNNNFFVEDHNLGLYLRDISKFKPLSTKEEFDLAVRIRKNDRAALDKLVKANLRFVVSVARNYQNQGMTLVDLINEGNLGLIKAAKRFDEKKNFKFISYAVWWIRQAILQGLADHSRIVKVPLNRVATIHKVGKVRVALEQKYNRVPNSKEIAEELGISERDVDESLKVGTNHTSLDAPISDDGAASIMDLISSGGVKTDELTEKNSINRVVNKLFVNLSEREEEVLRLYYGIDEDIGYTLTEIGIRMNITRERVRQIKDIAIRKLKRTKGIKDLIQGALL